MASLMDQARQQRQQQPQPGGPGEEGGQPALDWKQYVQPGQEDAVQRIVAAGVKNIYSPQMRDELNQALQSDAPVDQKLAENVVGLLLTLDQQSQGGLPIEALWPACMALLNEAAEILRAAGQEVAQDDLNDAALRCYVLIGKKLGGTDEQIMQGAQGAMGGQEGAQAADAGQPQDGAQPPSGQPQPDGQAQAGQPPEEDEEAAMARGMQ